MQQGEAGEAAHQGRGTSAQPDLGLEGKRLPLTAKSHLPSEESPEASEEDEEDSLQQELQPQHQGLGVEQREIEEEVHSLVEGVEVRGEFLGGQQREAVHCQQQGADLEEDGEVVSQHKPLSGEGIVLLLPENSDDEGDEMWWDEGMHQLQEKIEERALIKGRWDAGL